MKIIIFSHTEIASFVHNLPFQFLDHGTVFETTIDCVMSFLELTTKKANFCYAQAE